MENGGYNVMRSRFYSLGFVFAIVALVACAFGVWSSLTRPKKTITVTVFVHGSVFTGLVLFNSQEAKKDLLTPDCRYVAMLKYIREQPILQEDQLLLDQGWHASLKKFFNNFVKMSGS